MNIEEVKERVTRFAKLKTTVAHNKGDYEAIQDELNQVSFDIPTDFAYLLSIIEQAEKALEPFANRDNWKVSESTYTVEYVGEDEPWTFSHSALQAIRGKSNAKDRGGLVNPDGGDYPLKWMSQKEELE